MNKKISIQDLVAGCLAAQPSAQRELVDKYAGFLYTICHRYMRDKNFAEDMMQESLIRIFQNLDRFNKEKGSFETWITTIAIRECLRSIKKQKPELIHIDESHLNECSFDMESPLLDQIDTAIFIQFVAELPVGYRTVFNLYAVDGYNHKEISELLGITNLASRSRLNRAKNLLRKRITTLKKTESWVNSI